MSIWVSKVPLGPLQSNPQLQNCQSGPFNMLNIKICECPISFVFYLKILCKMKIESGKGKQVRKTLKFWGTHFQTIKTDISQGHKDSVKNGQMLIESAIEETD